MKHLVTLLFIVLTLSGYAQLSKGISLDEVRREKDAIEILILQNPDNALAQSKQLDSIVSLDSDNLKSKVLSLLAYGIALEAKEKYLEALAKFDNALTISLNESEKELEIEAIVNIAHVYSMLENMPTALKYYQEVIKKVEINNNVELKVEIYLHLAEFYRRILQYDYATIYLNKIRESSNKFELAAKHKVKMLNRFAAVWHEQNINLDSVIIYSQQAIELAKSNGYLHEVAISLNELGAMPGRFTDEECAAYSSQAISIWKDLGYTQYEALGLLHLIENYYLKRKDYAAAIDNINGIINRINKSSWEYYVMLRLLSVSYEGIGDFPRALQAERDRNTALVTNHQKRNYTRIQEITARFETEKNLRTIAEQKKRLAEERLEKEAERSRVQFYTNIIYLSILVAAALIIIFIVVRLKNKKLSQQSIRIIKNNSQLQQLLSDKEILFMEINHRVKNNMLMVSSVLEMQQANDDDKKIRDQLQIGIDRVRSLTYAHQQLYNTENYTEIELNHYLNQIVDNLSTDPELDIIVNFEELINIPIEKAQAIGFVVNELITNSLKHAWNENSDAPTKIIELNMVNKNGSLMVTFNDNGCGYSETFNSEINQGLGFMLINSFVKRQLDGEIKISNHNGALIEIRCKTS